MATLNETAALRNAQHFGRAAFRVGVDERPLELAAGGILRARGGGGSHARS